MSENIKAIRGFNDQLPVNTETLRAIEQQLINIASHYHYQEIRIPLVEKFELFSRSIGDFTDIIHKEMYHFKDRNDQMLALRPEGTAGCVRSVIQNKLLDNHTLQRLWYMGPMFRYERPQKGRTRQFHQFSIEAFGMPSGSIDVELILIAKQIFKQLQLPLTLEINWLGDRISRQQYQSKLIEYFEPYQQDFSEEEKIRLQNNPLRILDSKNPVIIEITQQAPKLIDSLSSEQRHAFDYYLELLDSCSIQYIVSENLVRGLDYYNGAVFEWTTTELGSQSAVCAGGRYDRLIKDLGGQPNYACGFSIGIERLFELYKCHHKTTECKPSIFIIGLGQKAQSICLNILECIQKELPQHSKWFSAEQSSSLKSQLKKADKSGATWAFIVGDNEIKEKYYNLKNLRSPDLSIQGTLSDCLKHIQRSNHSEANS